MTITRTWRGRFHSGRRRFDPLYLIWRALTSVRVAVYLLGLVALGALLGTVFPQLPGPMRGNLAATNAWLELKRDMYGPFTEPLYRLGVFDVFRTPWFNGLLVLTLLAVAVCSANRFAPTWRSVTRLQLRVPDTYFDRARHRARRAAPVEPEALAASLRRRHYLVRIQEEADGVRIYADRHRWAQLATFVSHLSLILLLAGGLVTRLFGYDINLLIAEGSTAPVFPVMNERQIQIEVNRFDEGRDEVGRITDFRSNITLYSGGVPVKTGDVTVNGPLKWNGFVFHQVSRQVNGAELQVRDRNSGQLLYSEVLNLGLAAPSPRLTVRDGDGQVLFDERLILPLFNERGPARTPTTVIPSPTGEGRWAITLEPDDQVWRMEILDLTGGQTRKRASLLMGESAEIDNLSVSFAGMGDVAWAQVGGIPGVTEGAIAMMPTDGKAGVLSAVDGGRSDGAGAAPPSTLVITNPINWEPAFPEQGLAVLPLDTPVDVGDYQYTFTGRRAFTGIAARRDPGTGFIWVAVTLFTVAICVTFYFPRRRAWFSVTPDATLAAGVADRGSRYGEELQQLLDELPARPPAAPIEGQSGLRPAPQADDVPAAQHAER